ncbi:MAG: FmdB family zinc ribbon protein [bacterium]
MPVYEFRCQDCNRVFSFLARDAQAARRKPKCPKCGGRKMSRLLSRFATASRESPRPQATEGESPSSEGPDSMSPAEEARMEREMMSLAREMESVDENDPKQLAAVMRRLSDASGEDLGPEMNEVIGRLEAGEDPESVEEKMGDVLGEDEAGPGGAPSYDDGLYDL